MRSDNRLLISFFSVLLLLVGCGGNGAQNESGAAGVALPALTGTNVMTMTVNGSLCSGNAYPNKPCVSVKVCAPGTSNCQTINDILLDTGSSGLRVFKSVLTVPLQQVTAGSNPLATCAEFGDGSSDWGPVQNADVVLAGEAAVTVPIQVIDSTFSRSSSYCQGADVSPSAAGFNGILGVGLFPQDCGADCVSHANNHAYYSCSGTTCTGTTVALTHQVTNPVTLLPVDNNGVIIELPAVPSGGASFANGYVVLGIDTQTNNQSSGASAYTADSTYGDANTSFNGQSYSSFLDTGSNALYFAAPTSLPDCGSTTGNYSGLFCPSSVQKFTATLSGISASTPGSIAFQIGDFYSLVNSGNNAFMEVGGSGPGSFDWGLPFHFGRNVYVGYSGATSNLGSGPLWAF